MHSCFPMMHVRGAGNAGGNPWRIAQAARLLQSSMHTERVERGARTTAFALNHFDACGACRLLDGVCSTSVTAGGRLAQACRYVLPLHVYLSPPTSSSVYHQDYSLWLEALRQS